MPSKRWIVAPPLTETARAALADYPPVVAQLLFNRGLADAEAARLFFAGEMAQSDDPLLLTGLPEAVERLQRAVRAGERIAVYGDYDTDGVTATALLVQVLTALDAIVEAYIPDREDEGYGLNDNALRKLKDGGARVVITVDCGIRSLNEADTARALGLDLIITDHHHPLPELPRAFAIVNPKQPGDTYPEQGLAGVGLAYKIAQGLIRPMDPKPPINGSDVLDLVALGTVADLAPLTGENRVLVRNGLKVLNKPRREGMKSLMSIARLQPGGVDATAIGFALGPRLNAAGRLESALAALELLTTSDVFQATRLAQQLEQQNRDRQDLTRITHAHARELALEADPDAPLLFAAHPDFKPGVVGLAAARLTDEFYRPSVVAMRGPKTTQGSARSIPEFHITEAFDQCVKLLEKHGGHAAAAGFTALTTNVDELARQLRQVAAQRLAGMELRPALHVDAEVPLSDLTAELEQQLRQFQPCGYGNPTPLLASRGVKVVGSRTVGADARHLKLTLGDGRVTMDAIAFNQGHWQGKLPARVNVAYMLEINEWGGEKRLQLNVKDIQSTD
ncbi:MAG: recJ [Anaerolineales bacterium]|nr:recJ [Anaerolineales bacterium]